MSDPEDLDRIIADIRRLLDRARRFHAEQAEQHSYALDEFGKLPTVLQNLQEHQKQQLRPAFNKFRVYLEVKEKQWDATWDVGSGAFSLSATSTAAVAPVHL